MPHFVSEEWGRQHLFYVSLWWFNKLLCIKSIVSCIFVFLIVVIARSCWKQSLHLGHQMITQLELWVLSDLPNAEARSRSACHTKGCGAYLIRLHWDLKETLESVMSRWLISAHFLLLHCHFLLHSLWEVP